MKSLKMLIFFKKEIKLSTSIVWKDPSVLYFQPMFLRPWECQASSQVPLPCRDLCPLRAIWSSTSCLHVTLLSQEIGIKLARPVAQSLLYSLPSL